MNSKQSIIKVFFAIILISIQLSNVISQEVKLYEQGIEFPTYLRKAPDVNPMFFRGESYQGASKYIYPYPLMDNLSNEKVNKEWKGVFLENEYIKACLTPEIGGKLYWAEDKTTGYNFFYKNNVVKPANIGMLGAWVSGGIEWNVLHHHRAATFHPVNYKLVENEDGSKTVLISEFEPRHRMRWILGLTAFPGKAYIEAEVKVMNRTPLTHSFLYWANVSTHCNEDYEVIFPPSTQFGTDHSKVEFTHWPYTTDNYRGIDRSKGQYIGMWKNHPIPASIFAFNLADDFMGGYDHGQQLGTVHVANHNIVPGAKLFTWGPSELGQMWDKVLTDEDGPYVEIMVGAYSDNQPDYSWIRPFETKTFKQYWYPISKIGGLKYANLNGATNLEIKDNKAMFGFSVTQKFENAKAILSVDGNNLFEESIDIEPGKSFTVEVVIPEGTKETAIKVALLDSEGNDLVSYQPKKIKYQKELPQEVKPPLAPEEIKTVEELYLTGLRLVQFYNPIKDPMPYFAEALKRDPMNSDVNTIVAKQALKKGEFEKAAFHFRNAIKRLTKDYTRPENGEALYGLGQVLKYWEKNDEALDTLNRAAWDYAYNSSAYYLTSEINCIQGNYERALENINRSLTTNALNYKALALKSAILRTMGNYQDAFEMAMLVFEHDPLNVWAAFEAEMALQAMNKSSSVLDEMDTKLTGYHDDYLETAIDYMNAGFYTEGIEVLNHFTKLKGGQQKVYPLVNYYLAYLQEKSGNQGEAVKTYKLAAGQSTDYCFPFRMESLKMFKSALQNNPDDAKAWYYMGNILFDHQPDIAISYWEKAVEIDKQFAIAYRNLGWGYYRAKDNVPEAIKNYEAAVAIKKDDPIYYRELDWLYELNGTDLKKRLDLLEPNHNVVQNRNDALLREIIVLTLNGKSKTAVEHLENYHFHIREGDMKIRDINVDAHLIYGKELMKNGDFKAALNQFELANTFPENQQVGRNLNDHRVPQIRYYIAMANKKMGNKRKAKQEFELCVKQDIKSSEHSFYQGLAYLELGKKEEAKNIFEALINAGQKELEEGIQHDVFAKFTENTNENAFKSLANLKIGLGQLGLGEKENAILHISKAITLNVSNLWAQETQKELNH